MKRRPKKVDQKPSAGGDLRDVPDDAQTAARDRSSGRDAGENAAALDAAARFIRGRSAANTSVAAHTERQRAEQEQIRRWAEEFGIRMFSDAEWETIPLLSNDTSEHEVRLDLPGGRVLKKTLAGFYGQVPCVKDGKLERRLALPSEYLERQALQNEVFASDLRLEGINVSLKPSMIIGEESGQPSFVISQRFIDAADRSNPAPSVSQIEDFLREHRFAKCHGSYFGWIRPEDRVAIADARPDNFILSDEGVVPIDLQMAHLEQAEAQ